MTTSPLRRAIGGLLVLAFTWGLYAFVGGLIR